MTTYSTRPTPRTTDRRWMKPAAAAAAIIVVTGGVTIAANRSHGLTPAGAATSTVTGAPTPAAPTASRPGTSTKPPVTAAVPVETGPRESSLSAIPWTRVGPGWTAATWSPVVPSEAGDDGGRRTLFLVSPQAVRYAVAQVPAGTQVADISSDGRRILTTRQTGDDVVAVTTWDVAAGTPSHVFTVTTVVAGGARFTRPSAQAVLIWASGSSDGAGSLERHSLDGTLQLRYAAAAARTYGPPLSSPDGVLLVVPATSGFSVVGNAGTLIRRLSPPVGYANCTTLRWSPSAEEFLAQCASAATNASISNVYRFSIAGAAPTPVTRATTASAAAQDVHSNPFGFIDAWNTDSGTIVEYGTGCGVGGLGTLRADGLADPLHLDVPLGTGDNGPVVHAVIGQTAYLTVSGCGGDGGHSYYAYDLTTARARALLGPGANAGDVQTLVPVDTGH